VLISKCFLCVGATAAVIVIEKEGNKTRIYSANCGDVRSVLVFSFIFSKIFYFIF
jgi:serine/threonine protein phosphatase PrpC